MVISKREIKPITYAAGSPHLSFHIGCAGLPRFTLFLVVMFASLTQHPPLPFYFTSMHYFKHRGKNGRLEFRNNLIEWGKILRVYQSVLANHHSKGV